ncbi:MAG: shikimate kinase [candidate division KSB1 bacterium]|nr:shikimate kinase [candidate division KSB1 bacterium]
MFRWVSDRNLYLGGFMASGKSTAAQKLSDLLGIPWEDSDQRIVEQTSMAIPEIFSRYGESYFRELETQVLLNLARTRPRIVALGGGAVLREENMRVVKDSGVLVCLLPGLEVIWHRVRGKSSRPLLAAPNEQEQRARLERLYREREPLYRRYADLLIETQVERDPSETVREILVWLEAKRWVERLK